MVRGPEDEDAPRDAPVDALVGPGCGGAGVGVAGVAVGLSVSGVLFGGRMCRGMLYRSLDVFGDAAWMDDMSRVIDMRLSGHACSLEKKRS